MWLCALLSLAALHGAQSLREVHPFKIDPSAISNIELLIPMAIPADSQEHTNHVTEPHFDRHTADQDQESDESYSSIPAYAFVLDSESSESPRIRSISTDFPKHIKGRSLYLAQLWPRYNTESKEHSVREPPPVHEVAQDACRKLAHQQIGNARELLLYLCEELIDVLGTRCDCCEGEWRTGRLHGASAASSKLNHAMPWFGPLGGRRQAPSSMPDARQAQKRVYV